MNDSVRCVYLICNTIYLTSILFASILKPEWWGAFLTLGILSSLSLGVRIEKWDEEDKK